MPNPTIPAGAFDGFAEADKIRDANMDLWNGLCETAHKDILPQGEGLALEFDYPDELEEAIDHVLDGFEDKFGSDYTEEQWGKIREALYDHAHASFT